MEIIANGGVPFEFEISCSSGMYQQKLIRIVTRSLTIFRNCCTNALTYWHIEQGQAVCVCPMSCPPSSSAYQTVCGSNGVSYGSECDLRLAACRQQVNVAVAYEGPCSDEMTTKSSTGSFKNPI